MAITGAGTIAIGVGVTVIGVGVGKGLVDLDGLAPVLHVPGFDLATLGRDDDRGCACLVEGLARLEELCLLESIGGGGEHGGCRADRRNAES